MEEVERKKHLTKEQRVPKCYRDAERILKIVKDCKANVKTAVYNSNLRKRVINKVYSLSVNVLKNNQIINEIVKEIKFFEKEPHMRKELTEILIYELLFGRGDFPGQSKPVETVRKYQEQIQTVYKDLLNNGSIQNQGLVDIPKYVRVNTLLTTLAEVLDDLRYQNVEQILYEDTISDNEYLELIRSLEINTFLIDKHFKDLLVFQSGENLSAWSLYQSGHVLIQDKSSYIAAHVLSPAPGSHVIDACAAPGMKTLHLVASMENKGTLYAFEKNEKRFQVLKEITESGGAEICKASCQDFRTVDPMDEKYSSVEYVLLDPSCSGSGMVSRMDSVTDTENSKTKERLEKLAGFQILLLKHACLFPSVKKIVYSTCSITETENEYVVQEVLNHFGHRFKLSHVLPDWPTRGSENYDFGQLCLRSYPEKNLTNGFFVAMLERMNEPKRKPRRFQKNDKNRNNVTKKFRSDQGDSGNGGDTHKSKKRKRKRDDGSVENETNSAKHQR